MNLLEHDKVIVGFRPEHFRPATAARPGVHIPFCFRLNLVEFLGSESILYGALGRRPLRWTECRFAASSDHRRRHPQRNRSCLRFRGRRAGPEILRSKYRIAHPAEAADMAVNISHKAEREPEPGAALAPVAPDMARQPLQWRPRFNWLGAGDVRAGAPLYRGHHRRASGSRFPVCLRQRPCGQCRLSIRGAGEFPQHSSEPRLSPVIGEFVHLHHFFPSAGHRRLYHPGARPQGQVSRARAGAFSDFAALGRAHLAGRHWLEMDSRLALQRDQLGPDLPASGQSALRRPCGWASPRWP